MAVGPGRLMETGHMKPMDLAVGDKVLLPEYGGSSVKLDGEEVFIYRDDDILGVLSEEVVE